MSSSFEDAADRKARLERKLRIIDNKKQAADYEAKNDWANALRLYTEILKDDPNDEEAQAGVQRMRESLMIRLYDQGRQAFEAGQWPEAIKIFERLLEEARRAGQNDYQDAQAKIEQARQKLAPPSPKLPVPLWAILGGGGVVAVLLLVLLILLIFVLRPSTSGGGETPVAVATERPTAEPAGDTPAPDPTDMLPPTAEEPTPTLANTLPPSTPTLEPTATISEPPTAEALPPSPTPTSSNTPTATVPTATDRPTATQTATASPTSTATATTTPTSTATGSPTPNPSSPTETALSEPAAKLSGKIAVPVYDTKNGTYNVYIAHAAEGWQPKLFLADSSQPAFSPDGRWIIVRTWPSTSHNFGQRLVLFPSLDAQAGDERLMTMNLEDAHPSLRQNDKEIVFHTRRGGRDLPALFTLGTWEGAESRVDNQVELGQGENPDWLGNSIVYYSHEPPEGLYVRDQGGEVKQILKEFGLLVPTGAPDGDQVAVSLKRGNHWNIFTLSASQGESSLTQLTFENSDDQLPVWSPDSRSIAFVSNRNGNHAVWVMNADGSNQRELFKLNGPIDGQVFLAQDLSRGWSEERLSWAP